MYNGCNKTALSSQNTIAEGFYRLLKEKDYSKISISEICKESGVSRQTFYSLFSSKENIVAFLLYKEYAFNPTRDCGCTENPTLAELSRGFAAFIINKADFIELLEKNKIIFLMQETLFHGFECCRSGLDKTGKCKVPSDLAIDFIASGLTTIAKHYVKNRSDYQGSRLEEVIFQLFSGECGID